MNAGKMKDAISHVERPRRSSPEDGRALIVSVEEPLVLLALSVTDEGLTEQEMFAVAVDGTAQVRPTDPANPLDADTVMLELPLCPMLAMLTEVGLALRLKPGPEEKPFHAVTRLNASIEPSPVAWS